MSAKKYVFLLAIATLTLSNIALAQKQITLEDIWQQYTFSTRGVPGFNFLKDGKTYTRKEGKKNSAVRLYVWEFCSYHF